MSSLSINKDLVLNYNKNRLNADELVLNAGNKAVLNDVVSDISIAAGTIQGNGYLELNRYIDNESHINSFGFQLQDGTSSDTVVEMRGSILKVQGASGRLFESSGNIVTPNKKIINLSNTRIISYQDGAALFERVAGNNAVVEINLHQCHLDPDLINQVTFDGNIKIRGTFTYTTPSGDAHFYMAEGESVRLLNNATAATTSGFTMLGNIDMNNNVLLNPADPTAGNHVGDRDYNDARYLLSSGTYDKDWIGLGNVTNDAQIRADQLVTAIVGSGNLTDVASTSAIVTYVNSLNFARKFSYPTVASLSTHNAQVGDIVFIQDDGDTKWAQYTANTAGTGASYTKTMDEDMLLNSINGAGIKSALFAEPDTNNFSDTYKNWIDNFTISSSVSSTSTTDVANSLAVKTAYDLANHSHPYLSDTGGNLTGALSLKNTLSIDALSTEESGVVYSIGGNRRFYAGLDQVAEIGSSSGSDFTFNRYDDSGALLGVVYTIDRSTGDVEFNTEVTFTGITYLTNIYGTSQVSSNGASPLGIYGGSYLVVQSTNETYFDAGTVHLWRDGANVERMRLNATDGTLTLQGNIVFGDGGTRSITGPTNEDIKIIAKPNAATEGIKFYVDGTGSNPIVEILQTGQTAFMGALSGAGINSSEIRLGDGSNSSAFDLFIGLNDDGVNFRNNSSARGFNFKNSTTTLASLSSLGEFTARNYRTSTSNTDANTMYRNSTNNALYVRNYGSGDIARFGNGTTEDLVKINNAGLLRTVQVHISGDSVASVPLVVERPGSVSGNAVGIDFKTDHVTNTILSDNVNGFRFRMQANSAYDMKLSPTGVLTISDSVVVPKIDLGSYAIINKLSNDIHMQVPGVSSGSVVVKSSDGIEKGYVAFDNVGFGLKNNSNQWMLRGSHDSQDVYFHADTWYAGAWNSIGSRPATGSGDYGYFPIVKGGNYSIDTSNQVGYLKISLPVLWSNHMLAFSLDIYDYKTNNTINFIFGGYNNIGSDWVAPNVTQIGGIKEYPVRFGDDGSKACIWIGDINEDWDYVKATIRDVTVGYSGVTNSVWSQGWSIDVSSVAIPSTDHTVTGHRLLDSKVPKFTSELSVNDSFHVGNNPKKGNFGTNNYGIEIGEGFSTIHQSNTYGGSLYIVSNAYYDDAGSTYRRSGSTKISNRLVLSDYSGFLIQSAPTGATDTSFYHSSTLFQINQDGHLRLNGTRKDDYWDAKYGQGSSPTFDTITSSGSGDERLVLNDTDATGSPYIAFKQANTRRSYIQHADSNDNLILASEYGGLKLMTGAGGTEVDRMTITNSGIFNFQGNTLDNIGKSTSTLGRFGSGFSGSETDILYIKNDSHDARVVIDGHTGFDAELKFAVGGNFHSTIGWDSATSKFVIGGINVDAPWVTVSSDGTLESKGSRPITLNSSAGKVVIRGSSGGWADGYYFEGSGATHYGGFGAHGTDDLFSHYFVGQEYNDYVVKYNRGNKSVEFAGSTIDFGTRASNSANGRGLLFERFTSAGGEASARIMWTEHNSTSASADNYGISWNYLGENSATFPSGAALSSGNATWSMKRHDGSLNGATIMSGSRTNSDVRFHGGFSTYNKSRTITTPSTEFNTVIGSANLRTLALNGIGTSSMWWAGNGTAQAGVDSKTGGGLAFWSYSSGWTKTFEYSSTSIVIYQDITLTGNTKNFNIINDQETASGLTISDGQDSNQHGKFLYDCGTQAVRIERDNSVGVSLDSDGVNIHQKMNIGANKEATIEFNTTENSIDFIIN